MPSVAGAALEAFLKESQEVEGYSFDRLGRMFSDLIKELAPFDPVSCVTAIAALSSIAQNRTRVVRLDALLHFVGIHCGGVQQANVKSLHRWLNYFLAGSLLSRREDPAEDVAIGNVMTSAGNYRVFTGDSSNPDYYAQDVIDALDGGPAALDVVRMECHSLLNISELLASRRGYGRNTGEPESESADVWIPTTDEALWDLSQTMLVHFHELASMRLQPESIRAFAITFEEFCTEARQRTIGTIRRKPLLLLGDLYIVAHPTAIAWAVTTHVFSSLGRLGLLAGLENSLGALQARRTFREATRDTTRADFLTRLLPKEGAPPPRFVSQTAFRFDSDKYLHLLFLHDDVHDIEANAITSHWEPPFKEAFGEFIERCAKKLLDDGRCAGGLTLVVMGGVWRACAMRLPKSLPPGCGLQVWSSADIDRLITNERRWKLLLWKLSTQRLALEELGVSFQVHSDANLYSMWTHHDFRLIPQNSGPESPNFIGYGAEFIFDMRRDNRLGMDDHCIYRPDRARWERVRKLNPRSYFKEDALNKTYGALSPPGYGVLEGAVETAKRAWWIDCSMSVSDLHRKHLIYQLWETVVNWLDRLAPALDDLIPELGQINPVLTLDISEIEQFDDWTEEGVKPIGAVPSIDIQKVGDTVSLRLPVALIAMAYSPTNVAERLLVTTLARVALTFAGVDDQARIEAIENCLRLTNDDRFMHLFRARDARDYLHAFDHEQPELLYDDELAFGAIHIAQEASLRTPSETKSIESSNPVLHQLVDAFWRRIELRLREIDRTSLVLACVTNHERLLRDFDTWQRTSRAVLSLHADRDDVLKASQSLKERRDRTQITNRILVEMAICTCPLTGGRLVTQADVDYIASQTLLLIATAAHSDAIRASCAEPSVQISRLGDFTFGDNFMHVMVPYLTSHFEKVYMADVHRYEEWFQPQPEAKKPEEDLFGKEFVESFLGEFGITPARLAEVGVLLAEDAMEHKSFVVIREATSLNEMLAQVGLSQPEIDGLWRSFVLRPRERWDASQKPFKDKDWFSWRFRRRLSLMSRPIVDIGNGQVVYAPGFCEDSFRHNVMEAFQGAFETEYFLTSRMREYCGSINGRRGLDFNSAIGSIFEKEGWSVRTEVAMTELGAPARDVMGDVDVLAWRDNIACICECKELLFARTIGEVADQLVRFRGKPGDDLDKHLRRVRFLQGHTTELSVITGIGSAQIVSLVVTSKLVPMQFVGDLGAQVVSADQITREYLRGLTRVTSDAECPNKPLRGIG